MNKGETAGMLGVADRRVGRGLLAGIATGAALTGLGCAVVFSFGLFGIVGGVMIGVFAGLVALIPWGIGVLSVGSLLWMLAWRRQWIGVLPVAILGFVPPFVVVAAWASTAVWRGGGSFAEWGSALALAAVFGVIGCAVSLVARRVAYCGPGQ